ncbi:hypothetical protein [Pseudoalteromonas piratica]|uniref:Secreted protein n=1 Tax=Pseudoalteromonas piratica TaxID=1348114 RepID=A0A0A7EJ42_9GAMM|nr:hypothetical protein [Pseudoalteromonas piratica]AIY66700.1 hypothetical protein OM33_16365 [Pseudoalteromonas piratica]
MKKCLILFVICLLPIISLANTPANALENHLNKLNTACLAKVKQSASKKGEVIDKCITQLDELLATKVAKNDIVNVQKIYMLEYIMQDYKNDATCLQFQSSLHGIHEHFTLEHLDALSDHALKWYDLLCDENRWKDE